MIPKIPVGVENNFNVENKNLKVSVFFNCSQLYMHLLAALVK